MKIILVIPAQPATLNQERQAVLLSCCRDGSLLLEGKDGKKPAQFYMSIKDNFPWSEFLKKMMVAWQLSDYSGVPNEFKPLKRIPQFVLDEILNETQENQLKVLAALRQQGYFGTLPQRKDK